MTQVVENGAEFGVSQGAQHEDIRNEEQSRIEPPSLPLGGKRRDAGREEHGAFEAKN
jgi:hypothetical protein